jgi:APA family basic amino acid/polyamine antiporter
MYGNFWAYLFGWASFAVVNCAGSAGIAFITSEYLEYFFTLPRFSIEIEQSIVFHIPLVGDLLPLQNFGVKMLTIVSMHLHVLSSTKRGILIIFSAAKVAAIVLLVGDYLFRAKDFSNFFNHLK